MSAAIAVGYTLILGIFVYRNTSWKAVVEAAASAALESAIVMITVAASQIFAWLTVQERLGAFLTKAMLGISTNVYVVLFLVNVLMLVLGMFMELVPIIFILAPIIFPWLKEMGVSEIQFAVAMTINLMIGNITPPIGLNLMVLSAIARVDVSIDGIEDRLGQRFPAPGRLGADGTQNLLVETAHVQGDGQGFSRGVGLFPRGSQIIIHRPAGVGWIARLHHRGFVEVAPCEGCVSRFPSLRVLPGKHQRQCGEIGAAGQVRGDNAVSRARQMLADFRAEAADAATDERDALIHCLPLTDERRNPTPIVVRPGTDRSDGIRQALDPGSSCVHALAGTRASRRRYRADAASRGRERAGVRSRRHERSQAHVEGCRLCVRAL